MGAKPLILLIDDDEIWLKRLNTNIAKYFDVDTLAYPSFDEAEERIMESLDFDLLITDIYENDLARDPRGLEIVDFIHAMSKIPVIVITADEHILIECVRDHHVLDVYDKAKFRTMRFVTKVQTILSPNDIMQYAQSFSRGFSNRLFNYDRTSLEKTNQLLAGIDRISDNMQILVTEIHLEMEKIKEDNDLILQYLIELKNAETKKDRLILRNKLKISIAIIPGLLHFDPDLDLKEALAVLQDKYDAVTFPIYEKLTKLYYALRARIPM